MCEGDPVSLRRSQRCVSRLDEPGGSELLMTCAACRSGALAPAQTTFEANGITMRKVPAQVCDNCGQAYLADPLVAFLDRLTSAVSEGCLFCNDRRWVCEGH